MPKSVLASATLASIIDYGFTRPRVISRGEYPQFMDSPQGYGDDMPAEGIPTPTGEQDLDDSLDGSSTQENDLPANDLPPAPMAGRYAPSNSQGYFAADAAGHQDLAGPTAAPGQLPLDVRATARPLSGEPSGDRSSVRTASLDAPDDGPTTSPNRGWQSTPR